MARGAEPRPRLGGGVLAGLLASLPVLGPVLGAACLSCVGLGGAAAAGAAFVVPTPYAVLAGVAVLGLSGWRSLRRARRVCGPDQCRRLAVTLPFVLGAAAVASYVLVTFVVVPLIARALVELGGALSHRPTLP